MGIRQLKLELRSPEVACASPTPAAPDPQKEAPLFAGIDTHKDTLAVAVIDPNGRQLAHREVPNTEPGFGDLLLDTHQVTRVGIEGSGNFGRAIAVHLAIEWQPGRDTVVVEVPTLMTSREPRAQPGKGKTDPVDALAIARITARETQLPPVRLAIGPAADLRALLDYRDDLIAERTALVNRVHADLTGLAPGYQAQVTKLTTRTRVRTVLALLEPDRSVRADLCRRRLERVTAIDTEAAELKRQIATLVEASGTTLTDEYGIGPLVAARFLADVVDARRYPNRDTFAASNGTAPLPASSGRTVRHRFNPGGNRQLNRALYTVAITQIRAETEGRAYYDRKRAEGKTSREAIRCLKRRLSDVIYRTMRADAEKASAGTQPVASPHASPVHRPRSTVAGGQSLAVGADDANEARLTA
ncbi:IS110 family RNA-guided transposase [Nocardioides terrigena]|uniref:IS110 family transposase n=1 Tax=Nocardioides terrigena TaxID=424797 RepID=UPI001902A116|nr:IS110 family transposase [Nocardioides terrigena]